MELLLPIFPKDTTLITPTIGIFEHDGIITYLQSGLPIYTPPNDSLDHFRFFTAKLVTMGRCRQSDIVRSFGVSVDSVARSVKLYKEKGESGFFGPDGRSGKAHKMLPDRKARVQKLINNGISVYRIAKKEKVSEGTIRYWIKKGEIKKKQ